MTRPLISVVIATFNSADRIPGLHESLVNQVDALGDPWGNRLQVLCVDGGSTDSTRAVASEAQWTVLNNPAGDPVSAKIIGWEAAAADLIVFIDHDELLIRCDSLARKLALLESDDSVLAVFSSGYYIEEMCPADAYLSEFGDAFSCLIYKSRNNSSIRNRIGRIRAEVELDDADIYATPRPKSRILLEIAAQGTMVSKARLRESLNQQDRSGDLLLRGVGLTSLPHSARVAVLKDDPVAHDPRASWRSIRAKGRWRLHNNLRTTKSSGGAFRAREGGQSSVYFAVLYLIHVLALFPLLVRAILISVRSRKNYFLGHLYLSFALVLDAIKVVVGQDQRRYGM